MVLFCVTLQIGANFSPLGCVTPVSLLPLIADATVTQPLGRKCALHGKLADGEREWLCVQYMKSLNPRGKLKANSFSFPLPSIHRSIALFDCRSAAVLDSFFPKVVSLFAVCKTFGRDGGDDSDEGGRFDDPLGEKTDREIIHPFVLRLLTG